MLQRTLALIYSILYKYDILNFVFIFNFQKFNKKGAGNGSAIKKITALQKLNQKLLNVSKHETIALQQDRLLTSVGR